MGAPVTIHDLLGNEDFQKASLQQKNAALMQIPEYSKADALTRDQILQVSQFGSIQPGTLGYKEPGLLHPSAPGEPAIAPGESTLHAGARGLIGGAAQMLNPLGLASAVRHPLDTIESIVKSPYTIYEEAKEGNLAAIPQTAGLAMGAEGAISGMRGAVPMAREYALRNPGAVAGAGKTLGMIGGGVVGEGLGRGTHGVMPGIGAYDGYRLGGDLAGRFVKSAEDKALEDVIHGNRKMSSIPDRLLPELSRRLASQEKAYADLMARTGQTPEELEVPKSLRQELTNYFEERAREKATLPKLVQTPEEIAAKAQQSRAAGKIREELSPEARMRGMAYAAGQHKTEWVPSKRGVSQTIGRGYRIFPRVKP